MPPVFPQHKQNELNFFGRDPETVGILCFEGYLEGLSWLNNPTNYTRHHRSLGIARAQNKAQMLAETHGQMVLASYNAFLAVESADAFLSSEESQRRANVDIRRALGRLVDATYSEANDIIATSPQLDSLRPNPYLDNFLLAKYKLAAERKQPHAYTQVGLRALRGGIEVAPGLQKAVGLFDKP